MTCPRCTDLCVAFPIRTPGELKKAMSVAADNLRDETLEEIASEGGAFEPPISFLNLLDGGPLADLVAYRFRCKSCGEVFALTAETYHGSGGSWRPERAEAIHAAL